MLLLELKTLLPGANVGALVNKRLSLALDEDMATVRAAIARLEQLLPGIAVDRFIEAFPTVLDVDDFERALEDAKRLMPGLNVAATLRSDPEIILSFMKGKNLIPYDPPYADTDGADKWRSD